MSHAWTAVFLGLVVVLLVASAMFVSGSVLLGGGGSPTSGPPVGTNPSNQTSIPQAPTNLVATPLSPTSAYLTWTNPPGYLTGDDIYYSTYVNEVPFGNYVPEQSFGVTEYATISGLGANVEYYFVVAGVNATSIGVASAQAALYPMVTPSPPTDVTLSNYTVLYDGPTTVNVSWMNPANTYENQIYYCQCLYSPIAAQHYPPSAAIVYDGNSAHITLSPNTNYEFAVTATTPYATSGLSAEVFLNPTVVSAAPTNFTVVSTTATSIDLAWSQQSNVTSDTLEWSTSACFPQNFAYGEDYYLPTRCFTSYTLPVPVTSYDLTGLATNTVYYISVVANDAGNGFDGQSLFSEQLNVTLGFYPWNPDYGAAPTAAPTNLSITYVGPSQVGLAWNNSVGTDYAVVAVSTSWDGPWSLDNVGLVSTDTVTELTPYTNYYMYVMDASGTGTYELSPASNEVMQATQSLGPATDLQFTYIGGNPSVGGNQAINISWVNPATTNATGPIVSETIYYGTSLFGSYASYNVPYLVDWYNFTSDNIPANTEWYFFVTVAGYATPYLYNYGTASAEIWQETAPPPTPTGLTMTSYGANYINVAWSLPSLPSSDPLLYVYLSWATGYYCGNRCGQVVTLGPAVSTYNITGLSSGTEPYYVQIAFGNELTSFSPYSYPDPWSLAPAVVTQQTSTSTAPTDLYVASFTSNTVSLAWTAPSIGTLTHYLLDYCGLSPYWYCYNPYATPNQLVLSPTYSNYTFTLPYANEPFYFEVAAENDVGITSFSNTATQETSYLAAPTNLVVSSYNTTLDETNLTWTDPAYSAAAGPIVSAHIQGCYGYGPYDNGSMSCAPSYTYGFTDSGANVTQYNATYYTPYYSYGYYYYWSVSLTNYLGNGPTSNYVETNITYGPVATPSLAAPTDVMVTGSGTSWWNVSWSPPPSGQVNGYNIMWSTASPLNSPSETIVGNVTSISLTRTTPGNFYVVVQAWGGGDLSPWSVATLYEPSIPATPQSLNVTSFTNTTATLSWNAVPNALYYAYNYVTTVNTPFSSQPALLYNDGVGPSVGDVTSATITGLSYGYNYYFTVYAHDYEGNSLSAQQVVVPTTIAASTPPSSYPTTPFNLVAGDESTSSISLTWANPTGPITDDLVLYETGASCVSGATEVDLGAAYTSTTIGGLASGTEYCFDVESVIGVTASAPSTVVVDSTLVSAPSPSAPAAPTALSGIPISTTVAFLSWTPPFGVLTNTTLAYGLSAGDYTQWLSVNSGQATQFTVSYLSPGTTYYFVAWAWNTVGESAMSSYTTISTPPIAPPPTPAAPTGLGVVALTDVSAVVNWTNPSGIVSTEAVYYAPQSDYYFCSYHYGTPYASEAYLGAIQTDYNLSSLTPNIGYCFAVDASNAGGTSPLSAYYDFTTPAGPPPAAPTAVTATPSSAAQVGLTWTNHGGSLTDSTVYVYAVNCGTLVTTDSLGSAQTSTTINSLGPGTSYCFRVSATNAYGEGAQSNASAAAITTTYAGLPTDAAATAIGDTAIAVTWTNPSDENLTAVQVSTWDDSSTCTGASSNTIDLGVVDVYDSTGLSATTPYCYTIGAYTSTGSAGTVTVNTTTLTPTVPDAPTAFAATALNATGILLTWTPPAGPILNYTVAQGFSTGDYTTYTNIASGSADYLLVTGLTPTTEYFFTEWAWNSTGPGIQATEAHATTTTLNAVGVPVAPSHLSATPASAAEVDLAWSNPTDITSDIVYEYANAYCSGAPAKVTNLNEVATSHDVTGLAADTTYGFEVAAINSTGTGPTSGCTSATTLNVGPSAPLGLSAVALSDSAIILTWTAPSGVVDNYTVAYGLVSDTLTNFTSVSGTATTYTFGGLTASTVYFFTVWAWNDLVAGTHAAQVSATTSAVSTGGGGAVVAGGLTDLDYGLIALAVGAVVVALLLIYGRKY